MSTGKAFFLGALAGAALLAGVLTVNAGSGDSQPTTATIQTRMHRNSADATVPSGLLGGLKTLDAKLTTLITEEEKGDGLSEEQLRKQIEEIERYKDTSVVSHFFEQELYGVRASQVIRLVDAIDSSLENALGFAEGDKIHLVHGHIKGSILPLLKHARTYKVTLEKEFQDAAQSAPPPPPSPPPPAPPPPPPAATITEFDTWAHNPSIGKSNICINVKTSPAQATISADLTGPSGYHATLNKTALDPDGTIQITSVITEAGDYTKTLTVYDANGNQTATVTKTFTVTPPPQDGPSPPFGKPCTKPTQ